MKRFIVTTILIAVIAGVLGHFMPRDFVEFLPEFGADAAVSIYCRETSLDAIDMGGGFKVQCSSADYVDTVTYCKGIDGVSVSFNGTRQDVDELCQFFRLQVSSVYEQDGLYIVCGSSPKVKGGVLDCGERVNLQIALSNDIIHIGSPLILGDY